MNPLCTLRYSATHVDKHHMLYRLDAVDAYERKLVKQIEVARARSRGRPQQAATSELLSTTQQERGTSAAKFELDVQRAAERKPRGDHRA